MKKVLLRLFYALLIPLFIGSQLFAHPISSGIKIEEDSFEATKADNPLVLLNTSSINLTINHPTLAVETKPAYSKKEPVTPMTYKSRIERNVVKAFKKITGQVKDSNGEPIPGVTITVLGTNVGTVTNLEGRYSIDAEEGGTLVFSFIGFKSQNVVLSNQSIIDLTLEEDVANLDEVIVVGYGTQKKANMTGAVATVGGDEIIKRPLNNVAGLLQGKVSGLQVSSHSGKPGSENNALRIRGLGTFSAAGSEPLVLINGIAGDMTNIDPNDIESISVLKDAASSAIYGARAANGVILITTKRGSAGELSVEIHSNVQVHSATRLPELLSNSADYMMYWNQGRARSGQTPYFSQQEIDAFRNNPNDPINYPNFDWVDHSFSSAVAQMHSVRISGGNEKTSVGLSLGYFDQPGITSLYEFKKYNARLTVDTKINSWLKVGGDIQLVNKDIQRSNWDNGNVDYQVLAIYGAAPNYTPTMTLADGSTGYVARYSSNIGEWTVRNPDAQNVSGIQTDINMNVLPQFYAEITPVKNLTWYTKGAVTYDSRAYKNHENPVDNYFFNDGTYAHNNSTWQLGVRENWYSSMWTTLYSTLNYKKIFNGVHNVNILGGYNQEYNLSRQLRGSRVHFPTNDLKELDAGAPLDQSTGGSSSEWSIMSFFGRAMYDYKEKYLVEANARYDGTSRITQDNRWGFFPSVSAGWRISQEPFLMQSGWVENLKIRASWGQLGNQNIGLYPYQEVLSTTSYAFNTAYPGAVLNRLVDPSLRWETTTMTDIGFDLTLKEGLIHVTFDWFDKVTDDILYNVPIPASVGLSPPTVNYGKMRNTGIEVELGSRKQFGDFGYDLSVNFSTYNNEVLRILSPVYGNYTIQEGLPFNSHYMVEWIGIFQNEEEVANSPTHQFNPKPGDLKFKDQNNDGVINAEDRVVMDGAYPKFYYGSTINLSWRNFDLNAFFQGVEGYKQSTQGLTWGLVPYIQGSPPPIDFINNMWTGEGSTNAHPAMYISGYAPVTGTRNSYWLLDASYLRLKNLAVGYNLPSTLLQGIGLEFARLYLSGDNLFTITDWPGSDPERANTNWFQAYPQITSYTLGLKVKL
ncbi:TonB-dependent receptor [uncultured Cyclobacterium sp.]|uniref:SusC/RagA family TonB-linked outer membrane protein n=1 Tax=uncultured Cyclobacterium sp. TaxID=453820 RepID=UPI0030EED22C|tara:strand:- start:59566 stop:62823 length:3258 start_codon:yes stop_codon:yes gene_type:complete